MQRWMAWRRVAQRFRGLASRAGQALMQEGCAVGLLCLRGTRRGAEDGTPWQ